MKKQRDNTEQTAAAPRPGPLGEVDTSPSLCSTPHAAEHTGTESSDPLLLLIWLMLLSKVTLQH